MSISSNLKRLEDLKKSVLNKNVSKKETIEILKDLIINNNYEAFEVNEKNVLIEDLENCQKVKEKLCEFRENISLLTEENQQLREFLLLDDSQMKKIANFGKSML